MPQHTAALNGLLERLQQQPGMPPAPLFAPFARVLCGHFPPDDVVTLPAEEAAGLTASLWDMVSSRKAGEVKVRLRSPHLETLPWADNFAVIEIVNDDMPFLVDSITLEINRHGVPCHLVVHPVLMVERDASGNLTQLYGARGDNASTSARAESVMHIRIPALADKTMADAVVEGIRTVLADVRAAVEDWPAMKARAQDIVAELDGFVLPVNAGERDESVQFLGWLLDNNFTFLGYRHLSFKANGGGMVSEISEDAGLGVLRDASRPVFDGTRDMSAMPDDIKAFLQQPRLIHFSKSHAIASVHRGVPMDVVSIKHYSEQGALLGEHRLVGLFTSQAWHTNPRSIPLVRRKVLDVLAKSGFDNNGHDGKSLLHILQTFPRDELYQASSEDLLQIGLGVLYLQERQRVALFMRRDPFGRYVSCFVYIPRDRYTTSLRLKIQKILEQRLGARTRDYQTHVEQSPLARVYFVMAFKDAASSASCVFDHGTLEQELQDASRSWTDQLKHRVLGGFAGSDGGRLISQYLNAFPQLYRDRYTVQEALADISVMEKLYGGQHPQVMLYRAAGQSNDAFHVKVFTYGQPLQLSDILPLLENLGLRVHSEETYEINPSGSDVNAWVHDFVVASHNHQAVNIEAVEDRFRDILLAVMAGQIDNDTLNQLVLLGTFTARQIVIFRTYAKYAAQTGFAYNFASMADALGKHPTIAGYLQDLFTSRFDPAFTRERNEAQQQAHEAILAALQNVSNVAEDRILNLFRQLMEATLRTNFYQPDAEGKVHPYVSIKLKSSLVPDLPLPRPDTEMFVYAPWMESIHLRGGKVARGGIRWSDRKDDYRTEVLGLVKAQMVKNAVIVPVGSKGGFICKRLPETSDRSLIGQEVVRCYQTMMRGMLDITDTIGGTGAVQPPRQVVRQDGDDPYLVVAADKGTATFSDIANGLALEYGFWLGDAFASGGSVGYDHKKMGITARGAWEAVKRHFREMGKDIQREPFTVVGVGDMAGDVFGNGMLLSPQIRLIAAFNHKHIFIDPNPDTAKSFKERERLFNLPASQWTDYDAATLSAGGKIFERDSKQCALTPEIQQLLGVSENALPPGDLIRILLKHPAELLWFGGIGTFVRASEENNADVGDKANDALRVTASELTAKVIGEGANLGMTQRARIEYALAGGRLNTDAIDNSAGVDTSDHEVNIKILLRLAESQGKLKKEERNPLLASMTDEVAGLVLRNNYLQTLALSQAQAQGTALLHQHARLMKMLEKSGRLNLALEYLPTEKTIIARQQQGQALTRPELAVLLAYSKIYLFDELLDSRLPDEQHMLHEAKAYFPKVLQERFDAEIEQHPLRRELIATHTANSLVNRVGCHFVNEIRLSTGKKVCDIARAYTIVRDSLQLRRLWNAIEALDGKVHADVQLEMLGIVSGLVEHLTLWFLRNQYPLDVTTLVEQYRPAMSELIGSLWDCLTPFRREKVDIMAARFEEQGVPHDLAMQIAACRPLASACDILRLSKDLGIPVTEAGAMYYQVSFRFGCHWLRDAVRAIPVVSSWQQQAITAVVNDIYDAHSALAGNILQHTTRKDGNSEERINKWLAAAGEPVVRYDALLGDIRTQSVLDVSMAVVASRMLGGLPV